MTWKEFKKEVERQGVVDNDEIVLPALEREDTECQECGGSTICSDEFVAIWLKSMSEIHIKQGDGLTKKLYTGNY